MQRFDQLFTTTRGQVLAQRQNRTTRRVDCAADVDVDDSRTSMGSKRTPRRRVAFLRCVDSGGIADLDTSKSKGLHTESKQESRRHIHNHKSESELNVIVLMSTYTVVSNVLSGTHITE